ncbi:hypothetical protein Tco_1351299 [Tanacetum coccineum]
MSTQSTSGLFRTSVLDLVLEALDKRQIGEDFNISSSESVYKFVSLEPSLDIINPRNCDIPDLIISIPYNLFNLIITISDGSQKLAYKIDELKALSGHVLRTARVQIPEDDLYDLRWTREEDGEFETLDPQFLLGSELLEGLGLKMLCSLLRLIDFVTLGFPLDVLLDGILVITVV